VKADSLSMTIAKWKTTYQHCRKQTLGALYGQVANTPLAPKTITESPDFKPSTFSKPVSAVNPSMGNTAAFLWAHAQ
jgi:hypothetical protein